MDEYLKVSTLATELGKTPARIHQLIRRGVIETFTLVPGGEKYISREEAERFKKLERRAGRRRLQIDPASVFRPVERGD